MIRYPASTAAIAHLIDARHPAWRARAHDRTLLHRAERRYIRKGERLANGRRAIEFWNPMKHVLRTVQFDKCIYCEMQLEGHRIQWDIEHFRPKDAVAEWHYTFPTGDGLDQGYYLLAYDLNNLAVACRVCNTISKRAFFPIAGQRVAHGASVADHALEFPYLLYPLGDDSEDPEQHIAFDDVKAVAKNGSLRGQVCIDLLDLNREGLQIARARWLTLTFRGVYESARRDETWAIKALSSLLSEQAPHSSCTKCFYELCQRDAAEADNRFELMLRIAGTDS